MVCFYCLTNLRNYSEKNTFILFDVAKVVHFAFAIKGFYLKEKGKSLNTKKGCNEQMLVAAFYTNNKM